MIESSRPGVPRSAARVPELKLRERKDGSIGQSQRLFVFPECGYGGLAN